MSDVTFRLCLDEAIEYCKFLRNDIEALKQDIADLRNDTTDIIDAQYESGKKIDEILAKLRDVRYME